MLPMLSAEPALLNCGGQSGPAASSSPVNPVPSDTPESDVDDLVVSFFDIGVGVQRIETCNLQLGDTWRGMQSKMSVTAPIKKIRKKSDSKPQSQINKCHNEKRRRELENETINQLEELLGTCLAEVKQPDKNGIVREATRQIQEVLKRRRECPGDCPVRALGLSPLQAGEITSTQPQAASASLHYSELTTLIEALKHYTTNLGWILLEINSKGEIECVTENIKDLVYQDRTELHKKSILSLIHANDHARIRTLLKNLQSFGWSAATEADKIQGVQARFVIHDPNGTETTGCVECVIHCGAVRSEAEGGSVMCVIRRTQDPPAALHSGPPPPPPITAHPPVDQVVFRIDSNFNILSCDLGGVENNINSTLVGTRYLDLVESSDRLRVAAHLQEAVCHPAPPAIIDAFRIRVSANKPWLRVSARSRLFRAKPTSGEPDFIMSTHNILSDEDVNLQESSSTQVPPLGGPLMTSVANGESSGCEPRYRSPMSPGDTPFSINDFDLDPWTYQLGDMSNDSKDRKDLSTESPLTPLTPQTPSEPLSNPTPPAEEPNRLRTLLSKKSSGESSSSASGVTVTNNRILKDLLKQEDGEATSSETSAPHTPHTPGPELSPLHARAPSAASLVPPLTPHTPLQPLTPLTPHPSQPPHPSPHQQHNSDMLLRILNDKSDEDSEERRNSDINRNTSQPSALLTQLLSSSNGPSSNGRQDSSENYLERMGVKRKFEDAKIPANVKRATPEIQQVSSSAGGVPCSSSTTASNAGSGGGGSGGNMSELCQKNQILVSLLARQQSTPMPVSNTGLRSFGPRARAPPPPPPQRHPHSALSTILQQQGSNVVNVNGGNSGGGAGGVSGGVSGGGEAAHSHLQLVLQGGARAAYPHPTHPAHPAHSAPPPSYPPHLHHHQLYTNHNSGVSRQPPPLSNDMPNSNDQTLSDILDEVIANMPDSDRPAGDVMMGIENRQLRSEYSGMMEENAVINAIRQSLIQCEKATKSPVSTSPGPPVYPVQSPQLSNLYSLGGGGGVAGAAARVPEGDASRARALVEQQRARLLQMQRSQQMLVSPEAAESPQADLGSTINALVSATPPNVSLTRTDYHHQLYHPSNPMGSNYGTNKITSSQQNPMLSRQLSTGGGGGGGTYSMAGSASGGGAAALHTPMSPHPPTPHAPYHRAPRPHLGGYYEESAGYCGEYPRRVPHPPHPPHPAHLDQALPPCTGNGPNGGGVVVGGGGGTSEYVRNELRAVVGARSSRPDLHSQMQQDMDPLLNFEMHSSGGEPMGVPRTAPPATPWENQQTTSSTTEGGSAAAAAAGDETTERAATSGTTAKASLLQKLLSQ